MTDGNGGGFLHPFLAAASGLYGLGVRAGRAMGRRRRFLKHDSTIVSIGNVEVGGTGKSPLALALAARLEEAGMRPVYVSRGYGGRASVLDVVTVVPPEPVERLTVLPDRARILRRDISELYRETGDEAGMAAARFPGIPLVLGRKKRLAVETAEKMFSPTHLILDDAFQSWSVPREFDVVLVDSDLLRSSPALLPAGRLREPLSSLARADFIGISTFDGGVSLEEAEAWVGDLLGKNRRVFLLRRSMRIVRPDGSEVGHPRSGAAVVSGIARPENLERMLQARGVELKLSVRYPDHHFYTPSDAGEIRGMMGGERVNALVTTEKDWVKLAALDLGDVEILIARLEVDWEGVDLAAEMMKPQRQAAVSSLDSD